MHPLPKHLRGVVSPAEAQEENCVEGKVVCTCKRDEFSLMYPGQTHEYDGQVIPCTAEIGGNFFFILRADCLNCQNQHLLFDSHLHGWNGFICHEEEQAGLPRPALVAWKCLECDRPLRVGYICADFRVHPVGFFLERVLAAHDPRQVEAVLYSDTRFADSQTARLRGSVAAWRDTVGKDDAEVMRMIGADRIDILIDLAGHTGWNRLAMFGHRAAPVQASWLGYFGTTGVGAIDYIVADAVVLPSGDEAVFTETPVRLPAPYLCWSPPMEDVAVAPFPGLASGAATFGCFNNRAKITAETVAVWAKILRRVEGSSLFLKSWSLADEGNQDGLRAAFAGHGVAADRLTFEGLSPRAAN